MLLSIGMIVKNEEKYLEQCLSALQPLMKAIDSELIIVDTGSTDRTVEIAKKYTDKVYFFEWINDFAAARNYGLEKCVGKWFMFLDADEILEYDSELIDFFKSGRYKKYNRADYTVRSMRDNAGAEYDDTFPIRLGERKNLCFEGKIHETFSGKVLKLCSLRNTIFKHYGYVKEISVDKVKRNDEYIEQMIKSDLFDARAYCYRMGHLIMLNNNLEAINLAKEAISKFDHKNSVYENRIIYHAIQACLELNEYQEANSLYDSLFKQDYNIVDIIYSSYILCMYCLKKGICNKLIVYATTIANSFEKYSKFWEVNKNCYNYNEQVTTAQNLSTLFKNVIEVLFENKLYEDEIKVLDSLYKLQSFNCWCMKYDIQVMKIQKNYFRIKDIHDLIKNTDREIYFIADLVDLKNTDRETYDEVSKILCDVPSNNTMIKIINNEIVPYKVIEKSSEILKSVYFSNMLHNKQTIKNTKKILDTKDVNMVIGYLIYFDPNFTFTVYDYMMSIDENFENQSDIMFMMQLLYYAIAQHSVDDNEKILWLYLNLVEFTYEYISNGGDIQNEELSKFLLPYNCKLALIKAENGDMKTAVTYIKEGLKYGNECAYIISKFLMYIQGVA